MKTTGSRLFLPIFALLPLTVGCGDENSGDDGASAWTGQTYVLAVPENNWAEPTGVGQDLGEFVPPFAIQVESAADGSYDVLLGTTDPAGAQQPCNATTRVTATSAGEPAIQIGPVEFPLYIKHVREEGLAVETVVHNFMLKDVLPNGATPSETGELTAVVDIRDIYELFTQILGRTPDSVCEALSSNAACSPCAADGQPYCVSLRAILLGATPSPLVLSPIDAALIDRTACLLE
jgi:hypothetical protein